MEGQEAMGYAKTAALATATTTLLALAPATAMAQREQSTQLISRSADGGQPDGPSTNAVISLDRRFGQLIAFQSDATDLVSGDGNGVTDVFAVKRGGSFANDGSPWQVSKATLVSRGSRPANGRSFDPSVSGDFVTNGACVAFRSEASNLVSGDSNGKVDAFLTKIGSKPSRVSGKQGNADVDDVVVNGNCTAVAWTAGGRLYLTKGKATKKVATKGKAADPEFSVGKGSTDIVFGDSGGVYLSRNGRKPSLVADGGSSPTMSDIDRTDGRRTVVAYEKPSGGSTQIAYRVLAGEGKGGEKLASQCKGETGNGDSRNPVIHNTGFYITFESDASNLCTNAAYARQDGNDQPDVYLYTNTAVREITLLEGVQDKGKALPGGSMNGSPSFYANYIVFDTPGPIGEDGARQVYMRYLGPV
jgi:hypothetical protein